MITAADIGIIVLAAGSANRFGSDKRRALLGNGLAVLEATLASVPAAITRRILVLKAGDEDLIQRFQQDWHICSADNPQSGMANSLACGIAMATDWEGVLIALGDMPYIKAGTFTGLQQALAAHAIVVPTHDGNRGNPAGFRKQYFAEMKNLAGDRGARSLLQKYAAECFEIETGDEGVLRDIDYPGGLT
jgi:molybdenum cofactor cytidylyltransferase